MKFFTLKFPTLNDRHTWKEQQSQAAAAQLPAPQQVAQGKPTQNPDPNSIFAGSAQVSEATSASPKRPNSPRPFHSNLLAQTPADHASHLPDVSIPFMSDRDKQRRTAVFSDLTDTSPYLKDMSCRFIDHIKTCYSFAHVQGVLDALKSLPPHKRTEPLRLLMLHLYRLPLSHRVPALANVRAAISEQAVQDRPPELPGLEELLNAVGEAPIHPRLKYPNRLTGRAYSVPIGWDDVEAKYAVWTQKVSEQVQALEQQQNKLQISKWPSTRTTLADSYHGGS